MLFKQTLQQCHKRFKAYEYRRNSGVLLSNKKGFSISEAIESEKWDYISVQQNSGDSGIADSYSLYLENLIDFVINTANEDAKLVLKWFGYIKKFNTSRICKI